MAGVANVGRICHFIMINLEEEDQGKRLEGNLDMDKNVCNIS